MNLGIGYFIGALVALMILSFISRAHADPALPQGVTCEQVAYYAGQFEIPNTWAGRARAKIIAAALGFRLTNAQLEAAARCLASRGMTR